MATHEDVLIYIKDRGYCPEEEILAHFHEIQPELVRTDLDYLCSRGSIKKVKYNSNKGPGFLYYRIY